MVIEIAGSDSSSRTRAGYGRADDDESRAPGVQKTLLRGDGFG